MIAFKIAAAVQTAAQSRQLVGDAFRGVVDSFGQLTGELGKEGVKVGRPDVSEQDLVLRTKEPRQLSAELDVVDVLAQHSAAKAVNVVRNNNLVGQNGGHCDWRVLKFVIFNYKKTNQFYYIFNAKNAFLSPKKVK